MYTASMKDEIASGCTDALELQNLASDAVVFQSITSEKIKQVLGPLADVGKWLAVS